MLPPRACHIPVTAIRCIDYSDPMHPVLWVISPHAWYKVAGAGWWDFVAPHPMYAPIFEPSRRAFAVSCLVARCLQSRYVLYSFFSLFFCLESHFQPLPSSRDQAVSSPVHASLPDVADWIIARTLTAGPTLAKQTRSKKCF